MRKSVTVLGSVLTVMALTMVATALPVVAGGGTHVERHNSSASGRSTSSNGQIVFRRYFDADQTMGALFVMNLDGSEVRQITYPPNGWRDNVPAWSPDGRTIVFQYLGSGFSPSFDRGQGWITAGRTGGFGKEGNADVIRILIRDGHVVRKVNLTESGEWDSGPSWGIHPPVG